MNQNEDLTPIVDRFSQTKTLVVGDVMLDRFIWGKVSRISPEAPVPVVQVTHESAHLGGAANVVSNIHALGGNAVPIGIIGVDDAAKTLLQGLDRMGISTTGLVRDRDYRTIQKTRIIAHHQQVVRVDREEDRPLDAASSQKTIRRLTNLLPDATGLIVSDYGKGVITARLLEKLAGLGPEKIISVDPKDRNFAFYKNLHIITPNQNEAERMSGIAIHDESDLRRAAAIIFEKLACRNLLITRGEHGMALFRSPEDMVLIPTQAQEVFDVSGAGDTVIAVYTLAKSAGATPRQASVLANAAAGVVVGKLGTATLTTEELKRALDMRVG